MTDDASWRRIAALMNINLLNRFFKCVSVTNDIILIVILTALKFLITFSLKKNNYFSVFRLLNNFKGLMAVQLVLYCHEAHKVPLKVKRIRQTNHCAAL